MKRVFENLLIAMSFLIFVSCNNTTETETTTADSLNAATSYVDLETGAVVRRDESTGMYVTESGDPVEFYIDMNTMDTFFGRTGQNVSNALIFEDDDWRVDESKIKIDDDEVKIENPDGSKTKIEDGETKTKSGDTKIKTDEDGTKVEND